VTKLNLKGTLKALRLNESSVSMVLGALVIVVVGVLVVNYFRGQDAGTTLPTGITSERLGTKQLPTTHTVSAGETLWKISEAYYQSGYNWVDIAEANELSSPGLIETGQVLSIPSVEAKTATVSMPEPTASGVDVSISGSTYTVVKGDSLWGIAVRAYGDGYKWVEIARENKLVNANIIHAGNILILPR
jgi:nucleoid-associated protein YgaU